LRVVAETYRFKHCRRLIFLKTSWTKFFRKVGSALERTIKAFKLHLVSVFVGSSRYLPACGWTNIT